MSDPYDPYQAPAPFPDSPQHGYPPPAGAAPVPGSARAAAVSLGIIGAIILALTALAVIGVTMIPPEQFEADLQRQGRELPPDMDVQTIMGYISGCMGVCGGLLGIIFLVLTPFVWRGSKAGSIVALVVVVLTTLLMLLGLVLTLPQGAVALVYLVGVVVLAVPLVLLINALRALNAPAYAGDQYGMQQPGWQGYDANQPPPQQPPQSWEQTGWSEEPERRDDEPRP